MSSFYFIYVNKKLNYYLNNKDCILNILLQLLITIYYSNQETVNEILNNEVPLSFVLKEN
jgi:hypothetical protein